MGTWAGHLTSLSPSSFILKGDIGTDPALLLWGFNNIIDMLFIIYIYIKESNELPGPMVGTQKLIAVIVVSVLNSLNLQHLFASFYLSIQERSIWGISQWVAGIDNPIFEVCGMIEGFPCRNLKILLKEIDGISLKVLWACLWLSKIRLSFFFCFLKESYFYNDFKL